MRHLLVALFCISLAAPATASEPAPAARRAEVLVLGVYHMANPGRDIFNMQVDDVLSPKRQQEIAQVIAVLKKFNPTRIAVEQGPRDRLVTSAYPEYVAGRHQLGRNETEQIGFRLARELGHQAVYGVDADGEFPYPRVVKHAQATGRAKELDALMQDIGDMVKAQGRYLATHTILESLLYMNADAKVADDMGFYYRKVRFGEPWDWAGADLIADWFKRNIRIHSNIVQLAASPDERILVIFGAGHLGWLQQNIANDPTLRLRKLSEFAP